MAQETEKVETTPPVETAAEIVTETSATPVIETPAKEETSSDFNEFLAVKGEEPKVEDKPALKDDKKTTKVEVPKEEIKKVEITPADKTKSTTSRDYSGVPDNVAALLKNTGHQSFDFFKKLYIETEGLKKTLQDKNAEIVKAKAGGLPDSYYEHPLAYALTPEFDKKMDEVQTANAVFEHWSSELQKIRAGATEYTTLIKDKNGRVSLGAKVPADANAETTLLRNFTFAQNQAARKQGNLEAYQQSFAEKHQTAIAEIKSLEDTCFPMFKDGTHPSQPIILDTFNKFPAGLKSNPIAMTLAKSLTANLQLGRLLKSLQDKGVQINGSPAKEKEANRVAALKKDIKEAGPTKGSGATVVKADDKEEVTMDDFEAVKNT